MGSLLQASRPLAAAGYRWVQRRRGTQGLGTNSSHIGWGIGAVVIVGSLLAAIHSVWLPWMHDLFGNITNISTSTGQTTGG